jgi:CRISPR-associated exonuclease Cas4
MLPLSFIAEYAYCPRSAYYLLTDTPILRDENEYIQHGRTQHSIVDQGYERLKDSKKIESSLRVFSYEYKINGKADVVEFLNDKTIIPVEFKRGKKRENQMHKVQIELIALCLTEMFPDWKIKKGAIFFTDDRQKIFFDLTEKNFRNAAKLAKKVNDLASKTMIDPRHFPAKKDDRCDGCCFSDLCNL